ncbi:hypothetical protein BJY26_001820 [Spelaeicoccus albus]|uniref:HNH nuclease domain-containing protein n=1 Tax=Spelaeicoccus albus TaxID=1280376 RepID=A0A7Z0D272_9MICO|nr:hypothetical protein [Spelaeicoccus albus]
MRGLTRQERRQAMHAVNTIAGGVKLLTTRLVGAEAASGDWAADGDKTLESWLGHHTGTGYGPAKSDVDMATTLEDLPALGQALEDGEVTVEHVRVTSRKYSRGSDAQKEALSSAEGQADLVHKAGRADAGAFGKQLDQDLARIDAAKLERDRDAVRRRRFVKLSDRNGGVQIDGFVDPVAGEHLRAALDAATPRPSAEDTRTPGNRRADALTAIARHALDSGDYKTGGNVRPHVMATLSASEWADWQRSGKAPTRAPGATIGDNIPLAPSEIDTLLCDCTLMRAVLDPDGQPVDLGRNKRTFTAYQRKALLLRDRHCTWPGCTMPGTYTEDHHVDEWAADNGTTSIDNGVLVCSFHHHYIHSHDITISPIQGGFQFTHPDGRLIGEHLFTRHDPPPAWAVGDDTQPHGDTYTHADKTTHADEDPTGRPPDPPPQLPLE